MDLIKNYLNDRNEKKKEINDQCNQLIDCIDILMNEHDEYMNCHNFIEYSYIDIFEEKNDEYLTQTNHLKKAKRYHELINKKEQIKHIKDNIKELIQEHNDKYALYTLGYIFDILFSKVNILPSAT